MAQVEFTEWPLDGHLRHSTLIGLRDDKALGKLDDNSRKPRVAVIGGSIAGLSVGIALRCLGCEVQIYKQSPTTLRGRVVVSVVSMRYLEWMTSQGIATLAK